MFALADGYNFETLMITNYHIYIYYVNIELKTGNKRHYNHLIKYLEIDITEIRFLEQKCIYFCTLLIVFIRSTHGHKI